MKKMPIVWKRLVKDGQTCTRCGDTGRELHAAVSKLAAALQPLGIEPVLETQEIDEAAFKADPAESNRVWIAGQPIEIWLGAGAGMTPCCSVCGDSDCRTIEVDGRSFATIPEAQIIRAGLMAAGRTVGADCSANHWGSASGPATGECGKPAQSSVKADCCSG